MNYFTADSHFTNLDMDVINRDFRPFESLEKMNKSIIQIWNEQASANDVIYHLGDFINYNYADADYEKRLKYVQKIKAKVILILGNNEKRILQNDFDNNFEKFRQYLINCGFFDVFKDNLRMKIGDFDCNLVHKPIEADKTIEHNLFGHVHKSVFVKQYGFNVGVDNHYFKLFSEDEILNLFSRRPDLDENVFD